MTRYKVTLLRQIHLVIDGKDLAEAKTRADVIMTQFKDNCTAQLPAGECSVHAIEELPEPAQPAIVVPESDLWIAGP